jgi:hypothetical protein
MAIPQNLIDLYATRTMIPYIVTNPGVPTFLRDRLFTNVRTFDSENLDIDVTRKGRDVPTYVKSEESGNLVEHDGFDTFTYKAPYLHEYKHITSKMLRFREPGENPYAYTPPAQQLTEKMSEDFADLDTRFNRNEELQAVSIVTTGKVTPKDKDGNAFPEIDYNIQASHKPVLTGTAMWSDDSVKKNEIIDTLVDWNIDLLVKDGSRSVGLVVMGRLAWKYFIHKLDPDNETSGLDSIRASRGGYTPQQYPQGVTGGAHLDDIGNPPMYCYAEWYRDPWTKQVVPIFPENMVVMIGAGAQFWRNYGFIDNFEALRGIPRFPWIKNDPDHRFVEPHLESAPLFSAFEPDSIVAATVC